MHRVDDGHHNRVEVIKAKDFGVSGASPLE